MIKRFITSTSAVLGAFFAPLLASAHEVYVLTPEQIRQATEAAPFEMIPVVTEDPNRFAFWAVVAILTVVFVFLISISRKLERAIDPTLGRMKHFAPIVSRVTIGIALIASSIFNASYGPELPLADTFGSFTTIADGAFLALGVLITLGLFTRLASIGAILIFMVNVAVHGTYMLTYLNYLGEFLVLLMLGAHSFGLDSRRKHHTRSRLERKLAPLAFPILRVMFGISLVYAAVYAKFMHNQLAFMVANENFAGRVTNLAQDLGFEPHFLVLGAGLCELLLGVFFILGIEIRFTALFIEFWLFLSLWYFGEAVWPHIVLIGIPLAFILHGYDKYSLEGLLFKKGGREPVL